MEDLLVVLGALFFSFLVLAAAVEAILEAFRGLLEAVGLPWLRANVSLEDALAQADELAPAGSQLHARAVALVLVADQLREEAKQRIAKLADVRAHLDRAGEPFDLPAVVLTRLASAVREELEKRERLRLFILRVLAGLIGCALVAATDYYVLSALENAPQAKPLLERLRQGDARVLNIILGGLGAAAGSSYWHDQLDKVRNIKAAVGGLKDVVKPARLGTESQGQR